MLGREVAVLVNSEIKPGSYEYQWDGSNLTSGVYFYRMAIHSDKLQAEDFSQVKKMILLK